MHVVDMVHSGPLILLCSCLAVGACGPRGTAGSATTVDPAVAAAVAQPEYDPATEIEVTGRVAAVREVAGRHRSVGIHLDLETTEASYEVHLGPKFYLDEIGLVPSVDDDLRILGSERPGQPPVLIARAVTRGDETWVLRDASGRPLWRRGRRSR